VKVVRSFVRRFKGKPAAVLAMAYLMLLILVAILAPVVAPHDPLQPYSDHLLAPPSRQFWLGTDNLGRDIFSRIVFGARISLRVGLISVGIALSIGSMLGISAGYVGGWYGTLVMRLVDILMAIPSIVLALAILATLGPSVTNLMVAVGISSIPTYARLTNGLVLSVKENDYVQAARAAGAGYVRIVFRHIVPNILAPVLVLATLGVAVAIIYAAGMSFIGLGAPPPNPEWGAMLANAQYYVHQAWWMATFPGLAITLTVLSINLVGDAFRDILDPRLRGV